ncbi:MAG TPA: hypothetical protein VK463_14235 [Desulfomonilaceae bacterium]|nr:hypothetical protein [Desulfomonilaceae bacterium]
MNSNVTTWSLAVLAAFLCTSCLTMTMPKGGGVEPMAKSGTAEAAVDQKLVDTWELLYQVNDKGEQEHPREATRTLIEFNTKGQVIFNRVDQTQSDAMKSRTGKFALDKDLIRITDDVGNTVKWPYQVNGDTLMIAMPEVNKKFFWRRFR